MCRVHGCGGAIRNGAFDALLPSVFENGVAGDGSDGSKRAFSVICGYDATI